MKNERVTPLCKSRELSNPMTRPTLIVGTTILNYEQSSKSMGMLFEGLDPSVLWATNYPAQCH